MCHFKFKYLPFPVDAEQLLKCGGSVSSSRVKFIEFIEMSGKKHGVGQFLPSSAGGW